MMICDNLTTILGVSCQTLPNGLAIIDTAFAFEDGEGVPLFIEKMGSQVRFFDDGGVLMHFLGRGLSLDGKKSKFIKSIAEPHGVTLNSDGELEVWADEKSAPEAFAKYLSAMVGILNWERDHIGVSTDISFLIDEIGMCLQAWKPEKALLKSPEYKGISGQEFKLDYFFDGFAVIALTPHHSSVGAALRKLIDIKGKTENSHLQFLAVIDDRYDPDGAAKESMIMESVAKVWQMTKLENQAKLSAKPN